MTTGDAARTVNTDDAATITGATRRQLHYWIKQGTVTPTIPPKGTGHRIRWSLDDCLLVGRLAAIARLAPEGHGIEVGFASTLAQYGTVDVDGLRVSANFASINYRTRTRWSEHFEGPRP